MVKYMYIEIQRELLLLLFFFFFWSTGQHRSLGPKDSKVRSLKMDASIWSNELIEVSLT